jgi:hypothetical protein
MIYNQNIEIHQIPILVPYKDAIDRDFKLSKFLSFGEIYDATKVIDKQTLWEDGIPLHKDIPKLHELIRTELNKPLFVGSAFRSYDWERKQNRDGDSQHVQGHAIDFNGYGLVSLIETAVKEKNELYTTIRQMGVNAIGFYDWGIHFDFRPSKSNGKIYTWDDRKKKSENVIMWLSLFLFSMWFSGRLKKIRILKRFF